MFSRDKKPIFQKTLDLVEKQMLYFKVKDCVNEHRKFFQEKIQRRHSNPRLWLPNRSDTHIFVLYEEPTSQKKQFGER